MRSDAETTFPGAFGLDGHGTVAHRLGHRVRRWVTAGEVPVSTMSAAANRYEARREQRMCEP